MLTQPNGEFEWVQASWGPALRCRSIHVPHLFSTRALELRGGDKPAAGWEQLAATLGVAPGNVFRPTQVHGDAAVVVPSDAGASSSSRTPLSAPADIIMTSNGDVAVAGPAADCRPLLPLDLRSGGVAAAHVRWRGTPGGRAPVTHHASE